MLKQLKYKISLIPLIVFLFINTGEANKAGFYQNFSAIRVVSLPEEGMTIYLNDVNTGEKTPATLDNLSQGLHRIKLVHPKYISQEKEVNISDGEDAHITFTMVKATAQITVNTNDDGIIRINDKIVGTTTWTGNLEVGNHIIKVQKQNHVTREHEITVVRGRDLSLDLIMKIMTGTLEVISDPPQAIISLNGRMYGLTPRTITGIELGDYSLKVEKQGYTSVIRQINIPDEEVQTIEVSLASGREVKLTSNPSGASVYINQEDKGVTPLTLWLDYGDHVVRLEKGVLTSVETINVSHSGKRDFDIKLKAVSDPFEEQMVFIKGGSFRMGDTFGDGNKEEKPVHPVTLSDYYIGKFEVTQSQWKAIMGNNPSHFSGCDECPVERVSWQDVQDFISALNELTGKKYRLPTEAEWEYAAKGGKNSREYRYSGGNNINFVSWFAGNSGNKTHPVGQHKPNELGLYDMSGNVWEWTNDWFSRFTDSPKTDPKGPDEGDFRIVKGGSWYGYVGGSRPPCRGSDDPGNRRSYIGFRLALSPDNDP
ncbi:MAG: formylglycine-generating enzyme family protein [Perlabentimonas sp.]